MKYLKSHSCPFSNTDTSSWKHKVRNTCRAEIYEIIKLEYQIWNHLRIYSFKNIYFSPIGLYHHHHHHHHFVPLAWISLTLPHHSSLSSITFGLSSGLYSVSAQLQQINSSLSSNVCSSVWRGPEENVAHEFVLNSPAVSIMFCSSDLDVF